MNNGVSVIVTTINLNNNFFSRPYAEGVHLGFSHASEPEAEKSYHARPLRVSGCDYSLLRRPFPARPATARVWTYMDPA